MRILAIETSCDETAIAVLEASGGLGNPHFRTLGNTLLSQIHLHQEFGGVVPNLAKREHEKNLPIILEKVLKEAGLDANNPALDYLAVTEGPGLEPALWTGITFAQDLSKKWNLPLMPVNHMEGHIVSVLYGSDTTISWPAIALLVSGGHTELVYVRELGSYEILGRTKDDAVGEAFDKVARLLGLPYPGGPEISRLAEIHREKHNGDLGIPRFIFPRPMIHSSDLNFSFSGLKTSVLYKLRSLGDLDEETKEEVARAFEDAAVETLVEKARKALLSHEARSLIVAGGVSANRYLRKELGRLTADFPGLTLRLPEPSLTTDNAVMIAMVGYIKALSGLPFPDDEIRARGNLSF